MHKAEVVDVTPENVEEHTLYCIKDVKSRGSKQKQSWFEQRYREGLRLKIAKDLGNRMLGFIEYIPAEKAWRPVEAPGYMFIHCIMVYPNRYKNLGIGKRLIDIAEADAGNQAMEGVCVMTSKGPWIATKALFEKQGYLQFEQKGRFELMVKQFESTALGPRLIDWTAQQKQYKGWHLVYADQCPWHDKAAVAIQQTAEEHGIDLTLHKLTTSDEAKNAPSGFGVFSLLHDGKLIEDHYISATRFKNILKKYL